MQTKKSQLKELAKNITTIISDSDGVLNNGEVFVNDQGEEPFGRFSIYDGLGIELALLAGLNVIVISARKSLATKARCNKLGIDQVYIGVKNKKKKLYEIVADLHLDLKQVAYIGDDLVDLTIMEEVGFTAAPKNAVKLVRKQVNYVTKKKGGDGALRDLINFILKAKGQYKNCVKTYVSNSSK